MSPLDLYRYPDNCSNRDCRRSGVQISPHYPTIYPSHGLQISDVERDLHEALRATRAIKNTFIPINKLPPEILSSILEHRDSEQDLVTSTHVCRHWRSNLTSHPSLWTCFLFTGQTYDVDRTLTYLERSKSAPLDVMMQLNSSPDLEVFRRIAPHIARTRSLVIQGMDRPEIDAACLLLRTPSPTLVYLEVRAHRGLVHLPDDFLGQQAPSLHSVTFGGIHPSFESYLPLPSLIDFNLSLPEGADPFHVGGLFRFLSNCPQLKKVHIESKAISQDIPPDGIISLESLAELDYTCDPVGRILPYLRLPRLGRLRVTFPFRSGQVQKLSDLLPHGGHTLLSGTTEISHYSYESSQEVQFRGMGTDVSFAMSRPPADHNSVDWFPTEKCIPFGQIESLTVGLSVPVDFPINFAVFENLKIIRIVPWNVQSTEVFLRLLHPNTGAEAPCPSLQEIRFHCWGPLGLVIDLAKERKRAGHQLALVWVLTDTWYGPDPNLVEELKEHVGEVLVKRWDGEI